MYVLHDDAVTGRKVLRIVGELPYSVRLAWRLALSNVVLKQPTVHSVLAAHALVNCPSNNYREALVSQFGRELKYFPRSPFRILLERYTFQRPATRREYRVFPLRDNPPTPSRLNAQRSQRHRNPYQIVNIDTLPLNDKGQSPRHYHFSPPPTKLR